MAHELYEQNTDLALALAVAEQAEHRVFVDVGAEKGTFSQALMNRGFHGTLLEPYPAHHAGLEALVRDTQSRVLPFAVAEADGESQLHIAVDAAGVPMDYFHSLHRDEANPHARHAQSIPVRCRSLGSMVKEGLLEPDVGVLKIDTEGTDLKVIQGMGELVAEVLICEFVTPVLYPTWTSSFPEALVQAAMARGYEECVAVKRFGPHEVVTFGPQAFVDGQWGNLIFTSTSLLKKAYPVLQKVTAGCEAALVASCTQYRTDVEQKEAVIQELAVACRERLAVIENLTREGEAQRAREAELRKMAANLGPNL